MNKFILQLLPLAFMVLLLNCQSSRSSTSLEENKEVIKDSAISINKQKETETTTIMWYFPTDSSFKLKENPFLWIPLFGDSGTLENSGKNEAAKKMNKIPNFGFLKIEKSNDKLSKSVEEQNKSKITEDKKNQTQKIIEHKNNWFWYVIMAAIGFFICLVVSRAKIIQKIFGKFKIKC